MRTAVKLSALSILLICLALICVSRVSVHAGGAVSGGQVNPAAATSNSMYEFSLFYQDAEYGLTPTFLTLYIDGRPVKTWTDTQLGNFGENLGSVVDGVRYKWRVSAGMDMAANHFYPNTLFNDPILGQWDWKKVLYSDRLKSYASGAPMVHTWRIYGLYQPPAVGGGALPPPTELLQTGTVTVHDSFAYSRYGGLNGDRDWLRSFPVGYPLHNDRDSALYPDPLYVRVTPNNINEVPQVQFPDEGTSTSTYTFQAGYDHTDSLEPNPWVLHDWDIWNMAWGDGFESGVMLYMRNLDMPYDYWLGSFRGHHMYKADPAAAAKDHRYILNVVPFGSGYVYTGAHHRSTWAYTSATNHYYESLPPGRYEYYFACSDDNYQAFGADKDTVWPYLDPLVALPTPPAPTYDRLFGSMGINYTTDGYTGYVDKRTYMPGGWSNGYPYDSWQGSSVDPAYGNINDRPISYKAYTYPQVDPGLYEISGLEGGARFLGTLAPYKRAVIPSIPDSPGAGIWRMWAETAGGTAQEMYTFQVNYWQAHGFAAGAVPAVDHPNAQPPSYVQLFIKNSWNPDDTTAPWTSYPMQPVGTTLNYRTGVTYATEPINGYTLGYGPHCYYFEAADRTWEDTRYFAQNLTTLWVGSKTVRYPRRPDTMKYDNATFWDYMLPGKSPIDAEDVGIPLDNDVINGPYINHRLEFAKLPSGVDSWSVTPPSGKSGNEFVYKVLYRDADNQRPYSAYIVIEIDDAGNTFTGSMARSPDTSVPGNSTALYSTGVWYEFHASSAPGLKLQPGSRRYRFAFRDDWGRPTNQDDRIAGETVNAPQNVSGWLPGPYVSENQAPCLTQGSVQSADLTSNEATTWNHSVTYSDPDNDAPAYVLVFIGRQNTPNGAIVWDSGNAMAATNPSDTVYSDGKTYQFSTRLSGDNAVPIKYYHCFVSSDGIEPAEYDAVLSPSSGMVWKAPKALTLVSGSAVQYDFGHKPLVTDVPLSSSLMGGAVYINPKIWGSVGGANTLLTSGYSLDGTLGLVSISSATAPITAKYWFGTEPGSNGPAAVTGNRVPTLEGGQVIPLTGTSSTRFIYSVTYRDLDGQEPQFVTAVIDNVRHPMTKKIPNSTTYKNGVEYQYTGTLSTGTHQFYFETSDGAMLVIFDANMSNSTVDPIEGPYVNDRPTITAAGINPSGVVDQSQPITYSLTVNDADNDLPLPGYPVVYIDPVYYAAIDSAGNTIQVETEWTGSLTAVAGNKVADSAQLWTVDQFKGMPVVINALDDSGNINPIVFKIERNTATELYLVATPDEVEGTGGQSGIRVLSQYTIGKLIMQKQDPTDMIFSDGVVYEATVPSLGVLLPLGTPHRAHFKVIISEQTSPGVFIQTTLRAPAAGELSGPTVQALAPAGNITPVLTTGAATPRTGTAATPFRFAVTYTDANGDSPILVHDQVTGYIRMTIEETPGNWTTHLLSTDLDAPNYTVGVEFSKTLAGLALGPHNYYFEASDGWTTVRLPSSGFQTVYVSRPPTLVEGSVSPITGNIGHVYEYKVKYKDPDNDPPSYIKLVVDGGTPIDIGVPTPGADYIGGVVYSYALLKGALDERLHNFYFIASDGNGYAWYDDDSMGTLAYGTPDVFADGILYAANTQACTLVVNRNHPLTGAGGSITFTVTGKNQDGVTGRTWTATFVSPADYAAKTEKALVPTISGDIISDVTGITASAWTGGEVYVRPLKNSTSSAPPSPVRPIDGPSVHSNDPPRLLSGSVLPGDGFDLDTYTYSVTYQDPNGDEPEYVECYIDDPNPLVPNVARAYRMTKDPSQSDYVAGVNYTLLKTGLANGNHTFYFKASDWLLPAYYPADAGGNPGAPITGPVVSARGTATINLTVPSSITIGESTTVTGTVTGYAGVPLASIPVKIKITKPDDAEVTPQPTVTTNSSGQFTYSWQPSVTGTWKVQASWVGSTQYLASASVEKSLVVLGPSYTVNGLDMISLPIQGLSSFPDGALGVTPGFALAKWQPTILDYKLYSLLPGIGRTDYDFPPMAPGQAYWIKTLVPKTIAPTGTLVTASEYLISLGVGWNQIGTPYTVACDWSALKVQRTVGGVVGAPISLAEAASRDWVREYGWTYDPAAGSYKLVDANRAGAERTMRPWRGYWVKARMYCTLVIPGPSRSRSDSAGVKASSVSANASTSAVAPKWQVQLIASNGDLKDECNYLGASRLRDDRVESPTCFQNYVDLYFTDKKGGVYASDLKSNVGPGDEWQLVVTTDKAGEVELTWDGLGNLPSNIRLVLIDEDGKSTEIVPGGSYKFTAGEGITTKSFQVEIKRS